MTDPEITVTRRTYYQSVQLLGRDDQGRQLYRCPSAGCGDENAYFDEEGRGHCPSDEGMSERLAEILGQYPGTP